MHGPLPAIALLGHTRPVGAPLSAAPHRVLCVTPQGNVCVTSVWGRLCPLDPGGTQGHRPFPAGGRACALWVWRPCQSAPVRSWTERSARRLWQRLKQLQFSCQRTGPCAPLLLRGFHSPRVLRAQPVTSTRWRWRGSCPLGLRARAPRSFPGPLVRGVQDGRSLDGGPSQLLLCSVQLPGALPGPFLKEQTLQPVREAVPSDTNTAPCCQLWHRHPPLFLLPSGLSGVTGLRDTDPEGHLLVISKTEGLKNIFKLLNVFKS